MPWTPLSSDGFFLLIGGGPWATSRRPKRTDDSDCLYILYILYIYIYISYIYIYIHEVTVSGQGSPGQVKDHWASGRVDRPCFIARRLSVESSDQ